MKDELSKPDAIDCEHADCPNMAKVAVIVAGSTTTHYYCFEHLGDSQEDTAWFRRST